MSNHDDNMEVVSPISTSSSSPEPDAADQTTSNDSHKHSHKHRQHHSNQSSTPTINQLHLDLDLPSIAVIPPILARFNARVNHCKFAINQSVDQVCNQSVVRIAVAHEDQLIIQNIDQSTQTSTQSNNRPHSQPNHRFDSHSSSHHSNNHSALTWGVPLSEYIDDTGLINPHQSVYRDDESTNREHTSDESIIVALKWLNVEDDFLIVGLIDGRVRTYHHTGKLVYESDFNQANNQSIKQTASRSPLRSMKLQYSQPSLIGKAAQVITAPTIKPSNNRSNNQTNRDPVIHAINQPIDILLVFSDMLVLIDGQSIRSNLRLTLQHAYNQSVSKPSNQSYRQSINQTVNQSINQTISQSVWSHRRWRTTKQSNLFDCSFVSPLAPVSMDELFVIPSINQSINQSTNCFIGVGSDPMIGYYQSVNQSISLMGAVSLAGAVAQSVFSYAKSFIPSVINQTINPTNNQSNKQKRSASPEPIVDLPTSRVLRDDDRIINQSIKDPLIDRWMAVTDQMGRIGLIDCRHFLIIRLMKGYREAQVEWMIDVNDQSNKQSNNQRVSLEPVDNNASNNQSISPSSNQLSLYLIVYAPRRGLLEVWRAPLGRRIGALNVDSDCLIVRSNQPENICLSKSINQSIDQSIKQANATRPEDIIAIKQTINQTMIPKVHLINGKGKMFRITVKNV